MKMTRRMFNKMLGVASVSTVIPTMLVGCGGGGGGSSKPTSTLPPATPVGSHANDQTWIRFEGM